MAHSRDEDESNDIKQGIDMVKASKKVNTV